MKTNDYHDTLECSDLVLDKTKLNDQYAEALDQLVSCLRHTFGSVQVHAALRAGLRADLHETLHTFAQGIANEITRAYVIQALERSREATANMFEALAAGAHIAQQAVDAGSPVAGVAHAFAAIAACEGRPEILRLRDTK